MADRLLVIAVAVSLGGLVGGVLECRAAQVEQEGAAQGGGDTVVEAKVSIWIQACSPVL
ncbi:hypothetical protein ACFV9E_13365 [Streptomyces sp. NPDC059835]|uniref:hypothetical protein n=1 Tax=Streptomyces sp. NPDC059835 TaxID=3346967 RepID=UPI00365D4C9E